MTGEETGWILVRSCCRGRRVQGQCGVQSWLATEQHLARVFLTQGLSCTDSALSCSVLVGFSPQVSARGWCHPVSQCGCGGDCGEGQVGIREQGGSGGELSRLPNQRAALVSPGFYAKVLQTLWFISNWNISLPVPKARSPRSRIQRVGCQRRPLWGVDCRVPV